MLSCQQTQNVIDGKKRVILNPSEAQRRELETVTFAEGEVYGIDILISSGEDGKASVDPSFFKKKKKTKKSTDKIRPVWKNLERRFIKEIQR